MGIILTKVSDLVPCQEVQGIKEYPPIYNKDVKGRTRMWKMVSESSSTGGKHWSISGIVDGKLIVGTPTLVKQMNKGKSNETSYPMQVWAEVSAQYTKKLENGYTPDINNIGNTIAFKPMLAKTYDDKTISKIMKTENKTIVQPKLDGIRANLERTGLWTRSRKPIGTMTHITKLFADLLEDNNVIFDGELYNHSMRENFEEIISAVRRENPTGDKEWDEIEEELNRKAREKVQYHIYDFYFVDEPTLCFEERTSKGISLINSYIPMQENNAVEIVESFVDLHDKYGTPESIEYDIDKFIEYGFNKFYYEQNYEGLMIRLDSFPYGVNKRSASLVKYKEFKDAEFIVYDLFEGKGKNSGMVKSVSYYLNKKYYEEDQKNPKPYEQLLKERKVFSSGIKGDVAYLTDLMENSEKYKHELGTVKFQEYSSYGIPRFPVTTTLWGVQGKI